jgi:hypothetical protein
MSNLILTGQAWLDLKEQAVMAVKSGLLPSTVDTPEKAIIIAMKGRELGLPPMQAFSSINVVDGKASINSETMLAKILQAGGRIDYKKRTNTEVQLTVFRGNQKIDVEWTIEDAKTAKLMANPSWQKYPKRMLTWRAISEAAHLLFPDVIQGCYLHEEISITPVGYDHMRDDHKMALNEIFKDLDVTDVDLMKKISNASDGILFDRLRESVIARLHAPKMEVLTSDRP